jgi:hypothetical protein
MHAAFLGATKCVRTLFDLSVDPEKRRRMSFAHFACAGGVFDICRELDNFGVDFIVGIPSPAKFAAEFGREDVIFWLWTRVPGCVAREAAGGMVGETWV